MNLRPMKAANQPAMATSKVTTKPGWLMLFCQGERTMETHQPTACSMVEACTYMERTLLPRAMACEAERYWCGGSKGVGRRGAGWPLRSRKGRRRPGSNELDELRRTREESELKRMQAKLL